MAGFLYYLPSRDGAIHRADLQTSALAYAFDERSSVASRGIVNGPDGGTGLIAVDERRVRHDRLKYAPQEQRWQALPWLSKERSAHKIAKPEAAPWVGYWIEDRPKAPDLIRHDALDGHDVILGDGEQWIIPVARASTDQAGELRWYCALPSRIGLDDQGEFVTGEIVEKFRALYGAASRWADLFYGQIIADWKEGKDTNTVEVDFPERTATAVLALKANYVVDRAEVIMLDLLTEQNLHAVLNALIDWPTVLRWWEKKTSDARCAT